MRPPGCQSPSRAAAASPATRAPSRGAAVSRDRPCSVSRSPRSRPPRRRHSCRRRPQRSDGASRACQTTRSTAGAPASWRKTRGPLGEHAVGHPRGRRDRPARRRVEPPRSAPRTKNSRSPLLQKPVPSRGLRRGRLGAVGEQEPRAAERSAPRGRRPARATVRSGSSVGSSRSRPVARLRGQVLAVAQRPAAAVARRDQRRLAAARIVAPAACARSGTCSRACSWTRTGSRRCTRRTAGTRSAGRRGRWPRAPSGVPGGEPSGGEAHRDVRAKRVEAGALGRREQRVRLRRRGVRLAVGRIRRRALHLLDAPRSGARGRRG